jgi:hypothetical protein
MKDSKRRQSLKPFSPICGDHPTIKELIDSDPFCGIPGEIGPAPPPAGQAHPHPPKLQRRPKSFNETFNDFFNNRVETGCAAC